MGDDLMIWWLDIAFVKEKNDLIAVLLRKAF